MRIELDELGLDILNECFTHFVVQGTDTYVLLSGVHFSNSLVKGGLIILPSSLQVLLWFQGSILIIVNNLASYFHGLLDNESGGCCDQKGFHL